MKLGDPGRAHATLLTNNPEIRSKQDAFLYAAVVETQPGTPEVFAWMLDLADRQRQQAPANGNAPFT
jgi:hypothetical protein